MVPILVLALLPAQYGGCNGGAYSAPQGYASNGYGYAPESSYAYAPSGPTGYGYSAPRRGLRVGIDFRAERFGGGRPVRVIQRGSFPPIVIEERSYGGYYDYPPPTYGGYAGGPQSYGSGYAGGYADPRGVYCPPGY